MLYWMCERSKCQPLSWPQMQHAICRNFGGLESEEIKPLEEFRKAIGYVEDSQDFTVLDHEVLQLKMSYYYSTLFFIKSWHSKHNYFTSTDDVDKEP